MQDRKAKVAVGVAVAVAVVVIVVIAEKTSTEVVGISAGPEKGTGHVIQSGDVILCGLSSRSWFLI